MISQFPVGEWPVILADPPWWYRERRQHGKRKATGGASDKYPTMKLEELAELPVRSISRVGSCILLMWTTGPQLETAKVLMDIWGFKYKTIAFVWVKKKVNPGYYTLSQCEFVLAGTRGKIPSPRNRNVRQLIVAPQREHSRKPDESLERIEEWFPWHDKIELFARYRRPGWASWGLELPPDGHGLDVTAANGG